MYNNKPTITNNNPKNSNIKIIVIISVVIAVLAVITGAGFAIRAFIDSTSTPTEDDSYVTNTDSNNSNSSSNRSRRILPSTDSNDAGIYKPIIYLYPERTTKISVQLGNPQLLTTTYPDYRNGWQVIAEPNGTLHNLDSTRDYYGLYWEGSGNHASIRKDGFVIPGTETAKFLEEKLAILGLTDREANEFIIYWLPQLEKNPYNYIRFETKSEIDSYMPLTISPDPDSVIRLIMDYQPLTKPITVIEQPLITPERTGFTVVEWGGTKINSNNLQ